MRTKIWTATCSAIALAFTVGLLAQTTPGAQTSQSSSAKTITVSGCLNRAQASPTGTSGTAGAAASAMATKFVLTSAAISPSATAGTSGTANPASAVASEYRLDADDAKLTPHVGHKVEITGTVQPPAAATQPPAASAANAPTLKVDNVKMVAATCP
jgi:hypothetical protein